MSIQARPSCPPSPLEIVSAPVRTCVIPALSWLALRAKCLDRGGVPEWSNGAVSKTVVRLRVPWVRIPPPPPRFTPLIWKAFYRSRGANFAHSFPWVTQSVRFVVVIRDRSGPANGWTMPRKSLTPKLVVRQNPPEWAISVEVLSRIVPDMRTA